MCRQDMLYKDYTSNPIPTSFFAAKIALPSNLVVQLAEFEWYKNDVGMGLLV